MLASSTTSLASSTIPKSLSLSKSSQNHFTKQKQPNLKDLYNLKIITSTKKNSGISYPNAGIQLLFVNNDHQSYIHSISRLKEDTNDSKQESQETRFETGYIDEVVLECDNLGDIQQLWVFPDEGTWRLEYIVLHHLNTNEMAQFNCNYLIGSDDHPAVIMRKNELNVFDQQKYLVGMNDYNILKKDLLQLNLGLVMICYLSLLVTNPLVAKSFLEGGLVGILYLYLLEKQTDYLGSMDKALLYPLVSGPVRLILIAYLSISSDVFDQPELLIPYALGFFMYKIAVIGIGIRDSLDS
jgi:hypothetical protein